MKTAGAISQQGRRRDKSFNSKVADQRVLHGLFVLERALDEAEGHASGILLPVI